MGVSSVYMFVCSSDGVRQKDALKESDVASEAIRTFLIEGVLQCFKQGINLTFKSIVESSHVQFWA